MTTIRTRALLLTTLLLAACAQGGGGGGMTPPSVTVAPQGVLLAGVGQSRTLRVIVHGGEGQAVWTSNDPAIVSVDETGTVVAVGPSGTALISATVGGVQSEPSYVFVATPVAGAVLLTDGQIVSGPSAVDPLAEPDPENPYEVVLRGVAGVSVGTILVNTEELPVGGRVVDVEPEGGDLRVRLVTVPPEELFTDFAFKDIVDLGQRPFEIPAEITALYDVERIGSRLVFTPKLAARSSLASAEGTSALPPLPPFGECETSAGFASDSLSPLSLSTAPLFDVSFDCALEREFTPLVKKLIVSGKPSFKCTAELEIQAIFEGKLECSVTLATVTVPAPGVLGLFLGGDVEFGVGFEVGGKMTLLSAKVGAAVEVTATIEAGVICPAGEDCAFTGDITTGADFEPTLEAPALSDAQFEPSVSLFGFIKLEAGNAYIESLQFEAVEVKAGAELGASLTLEALQIEDTDPEDGRSKYELALKAEVGPGIKLGEFLQFLGLSTFVPFKLEFEVPLGESPTGTVTSDRAQYLPGEPVELKVKLAPDSTTFPSGLFYNVDRVVVLRRMGAFATEELAEQIASEGQTGFTFAFDSPGLVDADELFAFVVTKLLPLDPPKLEIGAVQPPVTLDPTSDANWVESEVYCLGEDQEPDDHKAFLGPGAYATAISCFDDSEGTRDASCATDMVLSLDPHTGEMVLEMHGTATATAIAAEAAGQSRVRLTFEIHDGTYDLLLSGTMSGAIIRCEVERLSAPAGHLIKINAEPGVLPLSESVVLNPGIYEVEIANVAVATSPGNGAVTATGTVDVTCTLTPK